MTIIKTKSVRVYNAICLHALQNIDAFSVFDRSACLHFTEATNTKIPGVPRRASLVFNFSTQTLETIVDGIATKEGKIHTLRINADTYLLKRLSIKEIPKLMAQGYTITRGRIVLCRYLDEFSRKAGAGYDYIPDEDEYNEAILHFKYCKLELEESEMPEDAKQQINSWFSELKKYAKNPPKAFKMSDMP